MPSIQTLSSLFIIVAGAANIALAIYVLVRSKTATILRGERDAYQQKCERLNEELVLCNKEAHAKDIEITELRAKTDLTELNKGQAAMLANQVQMLTITTEMQKTMGQMTHTLEAMERRLDQGLIMK